MNFTSKTGSPAQLRTACLVLGVFAPKRLPEPTQEVDAASGGAITRLLRRGDLAADAGDSILLYDLAGVTARRVMLLSLGEEKSFDPAVRHAAVATATRRLDSGESVDAVFALPLPEDADSRYLAIRDSVLAVAEATYRFTQCKSEQKPPRQPLRKAAFWVSGRGATATADKAISHGQAIANGMALTKDLANLPGNLCTPTYLADEARRLARKSRRLHVKVLEERDMKRLGMGALLSVSRGSRQPAKLIVLEYRGGRPNQKPVALVGKGLTFDAGGISIKPAAAMDEMKYDMCGGASVLGALATCGELNLPLNVVGLVPASENLPDGDANKPGDIVTSMSGQTIEVLNTDAEGRLILCDALTYTERFEPAAVVDLATLTGACIVALGHEASGLMANDEALAEELLAAGTASGDRAWQLPLWDDYQKQLDSNFADMANIGGRGAGAITAGCFLARYTKKFKWAHLDIAGTAWKSGKEKGATGRPVPLLSHFLLKRARML